MYKEKLEPILKDIEDKNTEIAGGSVVGQVLSITNSLIMYICNLTIGKKKYLEVEDEVKKIKNEAENLKKEALEAIDEDKKILEKILIAYKNRTDAPKELERANKNSVEFCMKVTTLAVKTLSLVEEIGQIGNKMLSSDFKILCFYVFASVESSIVNVKVNLEGINNKEYKIKIQNEYNILYEKANILKANILKEYQI